MKRSSLTLTINETCKLFRSYGVPMEQTRLADGIESGIYPFGRLVRVSPRGRRVFEIWRCDVENYIESKQPKKH